MKEFELLVETHFDNFDVASEHDSYEESLEAAGILFDKGETGDFLIANTVTKEVWRIRNSQMFLTQCPVCGKPTRKIDMVKTHDCYGIPYRDVCVRCEEKIMEETGYDGEYYDETDENVYNDY